MYENAKNDDSTDSVHSDMSDEKNQIFFEPANDVGSDFIRCSLAGDKDLKCDY